MKQVRGRGDHRDKVVLSAVLRALIGDGWGLLCSVDEDARIRFNTRFNTRHLQKPCASDEAGFASTHRAACYAVNVCSDAALLLHTAGKI